MSSHRVVSSRLAGSKLCSLGVVCILLLACPGCTSASGVFRSRWVSDFGTAERHHRRDGGSMLICYSSSGAGRSNLMLEAAEDKAVMHATDGFIRCKLFRTHEPDRRYMAQFGVDRAPAAVVVYEDGTYRAHTGLLSAGALLTFLDSEDGPRNNPMVRSGSNVCSSRRKLAPTRNRTPHRVRNNLVRAAWGGCLNCGIRAATNEPAPNFSGGSWKILLTAAGPLTIL